MNRDTRFGEWASTVCTDPTTLPAILTRYAARPATRSSSGRSRAAGRTPLPPRPPTLTGTRLLPSAA